ncbi:MAG: site-2 protease family protein [Candidatus Omnitrophica bacterium]|nr:site-2 protease family protein [Candidatus Omnitrophota bacterium]
MSIIIYIFIIFLSIVIHEYAHGWIAYKLGDTTPKIFNRLTLNPLKHIDVIGTILLPVTLFILSRGSFAFGYAKPVPINPYNFRNPKKDIRWVGLAGPLSNLLITLILSFIIKLKLPDFLVEALELGITINLVLFIFNIIPLPPLDGSKIVASFLSYKNAYRYLKMELLGIIAIIILISLDILNWFILPLVRLIMDILRVKTIL